MPNSAPVVLQRRTDMSCEEVSRLSGSSMTCKLLIASVCACQTYFNLNRSSSRAVAGRA